jgi:cytochrome c oxidase subunit II
MSRKTMLALLAGSTLLLCTWAWAQQRALGQWPMGPMGQAGMGPGGMMGDGPRGGPGNVPRPTRYSSNGERIYYTGISARTGTIPTEGGPMWMQHDPIGCVACYGADGRRGVPVMMGTAVPEDIRYKVLTSPEHREEGEAKEETHHPPYIDATIKRAITQGVDPADNPLSWTMPRWQMSEADLNDLIAYLKTLR